MTKLHKKRIQKWVDALRSGLYKQAQNVLVKVEYKLDKNGNEIEDENGNPVIKATNYCCLGVACDLYRQSARKGEWTDGGFRANGELFDSELPPAVSDWLGFDNGDPKIIQGALDPEGTAINLNDNKEWSFKRIATAIERNFLK